MRQMAISVCPACRTRAHIPVERIHCLRHCKHCGQLVQAGHMRGATSTEEQHPGIADRGSAEDPQAELIWPLLATGVLLLLVLVGLATGIGSHNPSMAAPSQPHPPSPVSEWSRHPEEAEVSSRAGPGSPAGPTVRAGSPEQHAAVDFEKAAPIITPVPPATSVMPVAPLRPPAVQALLSVPVAGPTSANPQPADPPREVPLVQQPAPLPRPSAPPRPPPTTIELTEALSRGLVVATARGSGLDEVRVTLESRSSNPLQVTIAPGTIFRCNSRGTQNMVAISDRRVTLQSSGSSESVTADAACINMELDTPGSADTFTIGRAAPSSDLSKLLALPHFQREPFRVQQFAIWTITDNPARDDFVGIGDSGLGTGPSSSELQRIRALFVAAAIPVRQYRALR